MEPLESIQHPINLREVDELTYPEIQSLDRDRTVSFCAVSALEVHGPHLPIGADLHQAIWMADETGRRFAERHPDWTVLRFPPLPIGTDELPLPGSVNTPPRVVYKAVLAFGNQLARAGFRTIVLTNAHGGPRHAAALEAACRRVSRKHGIAMITPSIRALHRMVTGQTLDQVEARIGRHLTEPERQGLTSGEHAGTWETSWYLAQRPHLVAPEYKSLGADEPPKLEFLARLGDRIGGWLERRGRESSGARVRETVVALSGSVGWLLNARSGYGRDGERVTYKGWPGVASPEVGRTYAELPVEMSLEDLEAVIEGRLDPSDVRSIASDPALIQPWFLRTAALVGIVGVMLVIWLLF
jgi:creatinine amidohydrolase